MLDDADFYANFGYLQSVNLPVMISEVSADNSTACYDSNQTNVPSPPAYMNGPGGLINNAKANGIGSNAWALDWPNVLVPEAALIADQSSTTPTWPTLDFSLWGPNGCGVKAPPIGPGYDFQQYFLFGVVPTPN